MTNILYRSSASSTPPLATTIKGTPITTVEFDANLKSISDDINTKAPVNNTMLTGVPIAPTAAAGTNTTQLATTEFVTAANNLKADISSPTISSPTFTGVPIAPTAGQGTATTQLATTAFVITEKVVERTTFATLTNKTLTSPILNNPVITNPQNTEVILTDAATVSWDMNLGHVARWIVSVTGRSLAAPTNYKVGGQYTLFLGLVTPATMAPTWPSIILWNYGVEPDLTTTNWTIISLVWSSAHGKFLGTYSPGF